MTFLKSIQDNDRRFNNADSFAMAFDAAWKNYTHGTENRLPDKDEKLKEILATIKDHPFLKESPTKAKEVAEFRMRLLNLS